MRLRRICVRAALGVLAVGMAAGCGGPVQPTPTAIPASVVRPVQPTPVYPERANVYTLLTPAAAPQFVTPPADRIEVDSTAAGAARAAITLYIQNQTPSAMGIAPGGAAIYAERGGRSLAAVPVGGVLTVTGKSADGAWYAVYNDAAVYGWTPAGQLRVYGDDDLVVVEEAPDPAPIATLLAQAAEPVTVLDELMVQMEATVTAVAVEAASQPTLAPSPVPTVAPVETVPPQPVLLPVATPAPVEAPAEAGEAQSALAADGAAGVVSSEGRLNLRAQPDTAAAIVRKLEPGEAVAILGRSEDGAWLNVRVADGATGWVAAEYVVVQ